MPALLVGVIPMFSLGWLPAGAAVLAAELGVLPYPLAIMVALAASSASTPPIATPNTMVATAGGYGFADLVRVGLPFVLILGLVSTSLVPWLVSLH